jgi:hypothetical protein
VECLDRERELDGVNDRRRKSYFSRLECTKSRPWERFARIRTSTHTNGVARVGSRPPDRILSATLPVSKLIRSDEELSGDRSSRNNGKTHGWYL